MKNTLHADFDRPLQWGRNFIVAEILASSNAALHMDSLQWGRNFIVAEILKEQQHALRAKSCFNGAATLSLRKCQSIPNHFVQFEPLQWGRNFIVAEIGYSGDYADGLYVQASMGPQLYRCGNPTHSREYYAQAGASMGPQLYRCGNALC